MYSKRKTPDSWRTGWKAKACTSFVLYLKVFKNHLYYLRHVRVSIKPCLHTQLPEHNKSYRKVSWGWGHLITWNGPRMGHLNSFPPREGGICTKIFQKFKCPGGCPGGMLKLRFDWYIISQTQKLYVFLYCKKKMWSFHRTIVLNLYLVSVFSSTLPKAKRFLGISATQILIQSH